MIYFCVFTSHVDCEKTTSCLFLLKGLGYEKEKTQILQFIIFLDRIWRFFFFQLLVTNKLNIFFPTVNVYELKRYFYFIFALIKIVKSIIQNFEDNVHWNRWLESSNLIVCYDLESWNVSFLKCRKCIVYIYSVQYYQRNYGVDSWIVMWYAFPYSIRI